MRMHPQASEIHQEEQLLLEDIYIHTLATRMYCISCPVALHTALLMPYEIDSIRLSFVQTVRHRFDSYHII